MNESILFQAPVAHPQTHALVIGVGDYPFLKGGNGTYTHAAAEGMGQLTTAPASARAFVKWLMDPEGFSYAAPQSSPLGSVRVLISERTPSPITDIAGNVMNSANGAPFFPPRADLENVRVAVNEWFDALSTDESDFGIFFFAGHGVSFGPDQSLLLSDFGVQKRAPYANAIAFNQLYLGMAQAKSRQQCYFIDACRSRSTYRAAGARSGDGFIDLAPNGLNRQWKPRAAPIFNATLMEEQSFGVANTPSFFTSALLHALKGAGADKANRNLVWRSEANVLNKAMSFLIDELNREHNLERAQINAGENMSTLYIHTLAKPPQIPIAIECDPAEHAAAARFQWNDQALRTDTRPIFLPYGRQTLQGYFDGPLGPLTGMADCDVTPPFAWVKVELR